MAHARKRYVTKTISKFLTFFPVVSLQGARQTGKSFLARDLLLPHFDHYQYYTLDDETILSQTQDSAKLFLSENDQFKPLVIDEAQKSSKLFDAIKLRVDSKRIPGKYLLLGSTEFSKETNIREALTGRLGRVKVFPLTLNELHGLEQKSTPKLSDFANNLERGGLPGICYARDQQHRRALFQDWISITCLRDIHQFKKLKLDGILAQNIFKQTALLPEPTRANIASALKVDARKIETHLNALTQLFAITRLDPHPSGSGKPIYLPFDCGIAHHLGANRERCLHIWTLNEKLVENVIKHNSEKIFYYYKSTGKKLIHVVEEDLKQKILATQIITHDSIKKTDSELMKAFLIKNKNAKGVILAPVDEKIKINEIQYQSYLEARCSIK